MVTTEEALEPSSMSVVADLSVADAIWLSAAVLTKGQLMEGKGPDLPDSQILAGTASFFTKATRQSIDQHIRQHCVANKEAKPNRSCVLFETEDGKRRLYRKGDPRHSSRDGAPCHPKWETLPDECKELRDWYENVWNSPDAIVANDPLLNAIGSAKDLWGGTGADEYVRQMRSDWGERL